MSKIDANAGRFKYLEKLGISPRKVEVAREVGVIDATHVADCAAKRLKAEAQAAQAAGERWRRPEVYDTWTCHVPTIEHVKTESETIFKQLDLSEERTEGLRKDFQEAFIPAPTVIDKTGPET